MRWIGMGEVLHLGALLPAAVGTCCVLGSRRSGRVIAGVSALVMLAAMLDATVRMPGLPTFVWAAVLVSLALLGAFGARLATGSGSGPGSGRGPAEEARMAGHTAGMAVHGGVGLVVMAALLLAMSVGSSGDAGVVASGHHGGSGWLAPLAGTVAVGYLLFSLVFARTLLSASDRGLRTALPALEVASMGVSAALMAAALLPA
ncbi:hypothetical protein [Herbiconiux sp.]|uniref:hypothetical protein n=1 Tax=Herbiconiux sp. TaxID=1871186 RepID=UPI0025BBA088|nr:hypothetical protein [Herbiconiux sp.]